MKRQVQLKNKMFKEYKGLVPQLKQRIKLKSKLLLVENFEEKADNSYYVLSICMSDVTIFYLLSLTYLQQ